MLKKRVKSFGYAIEGIQHVFKTQFNMKIHSAMAALVVICGFLFNISTTEWLICVLSIGMVLAAEAANTAIELVVDLASPHKNKLAKHAKDTAAGAVLLAATFAALAGLIIFMPKGWALLELLVKTAINYL